MKTWPIWCFILWVALAGCGSTETYFSTSLQVNHPMFASVGSSLIEWEEGVRGKSSKEVAEACRHELLYSGLQGKTLNITYREYWPASSSEHIRPAFSQDLKYDLGQDGKTIVTFREVRIEVTEATNERIGFMVTHGPSGARVNAEPMTIQTDEQAPVNIYPK